ncbi:hypothetical protein MKX01_028719 [Papaver californicum]|nr:hypothetical protein MKX01_028719 [Papaver californicum]
MAAFTYQQQHPHFQLDSLFMSNNNYIINPIYFPSMQDSVQTDNNFQQIGSEKIEPSINDKIKQTTTDTPTSSIVVDLEGADDQVINSQEKNNPPSMEKKKRKNGSWLDSDINQSKDGKQKSKPKKQKKCELVVKEEKEIKDDKKKKKKKKDVKDAADHKQTDYVHVRARRGQASDSHSLAERVRYYTTVSLNFLFYFIPIFNIIWASGLSWRIPFATSLGGFER